MSRLLTKEISYTIDRCSLGVVLIAQSERGICAIFLDDDPEKLVNYLSARFPRAQLMHTPEKLSLLAKKVIHFIEHPATKPDFTLDLIGTDFQQKVWKALQNIPVGKTLSYTAIAQQIGTAGAVRAVAGACAANNIAIVIPCHRVIKNDGSLSGYRWGVARKESLLKREGVI